VQCGSNIEDFAKLFYAPLVISNGSSFAFMSGFFGKGVFVSTAHQSEMNPDVICENCKEWAIPNYNILHKDVEDYYDTGSTLSLLWK
jgi:fructose-specific component phosphotransferase system IIB-like protein